MAEMIKGKLAFIVNVEGVLPASNLIISRTYSIFYALDEDSAHRMVLDVYQERYPGHYLKIIDSFEITENIRQYVEQVYGIKLDREKIQEPDTLPLSTYWATRND